MAIYGLEILLSKLQEMSEQVNSFGYECDVIAAYDALPRIQMYIRDPEESDITIYDTIQITCIPPDNDTFSHFIINTVSKQDAKGKNYRSLQAVCDFFNQSTTGGFAYINDTYDKVIYRAMLYEAGEPVSLKVFKLFIEQYVDGLSILRQYIDRIS